MTSWIVRECPNPPRCPHKVNGGQCRRQLLWRQPGMRWCCVSCEPPTACDAQELTVWGTHADLTRLGLIKARDTRRAQPWQG